jgi:hypothetical protein
LSGLRGLWQHAVSQIFVDFAPNPEQKACRNAMLSHCISML